MINTIQLRHRTLLGASIFAPDFEDYPNYRIDSALLPLVMTWVDIAMPDESGSQIDARVRSTFFVESLGQDNWVRAKTRCDTLFTTLLAGWHITANNAYLNEERPLYRVAPGSVRLSGPYETVRAPDGEPFHGLTLEFQITWDPEDTTCDPE